MEFDVQRERNVRVRAFPFSIGIPRFPPGLSQEIQKDCGQLESWLECAGRPRLKACTDSLEDVLCLIGKTSKWPITCKTHRRVLLAPFLDSRLELKVKFFRTSAHTKMDLAWSASWSFAYTSPSWQGSCQSLLAYVPSGRFLVNFLSLIAIIIPSCFIVGIPLRPLHRLVHSLFFWLRHKDLPTLFKEAWHPHKHSLIEATDHLRMVVGEWKKSKFGNLFWTSGSAFT